LHPPILLDVLRNHFILYFVDLLCYLTGEYLTPCYQTQQHGVMPVCIQDRFAGFIVARLAPGCYFLI
jgi:hypothetical protein